MSFSEFTKDDFRVIDEAYASLLEIARRRCRNEEEIDCVQKSFEFANQAHKNVRRRSGEPYILHPIEVAKIVVSEIGLGYKSICAALLHDVVEDTGYTVDDIRSLFGDKIASLVDGLTKIKTVLDNEDRKGATASTESLQAENFKRILLTLNDDIRVVLIKLADRLHNCRTIEFMPEHKRDKILSETMYIFIPLAHRLGLYGVKSEMENIWLKYKEPEDYRDITVITNLYSENFSRRRDWISRPKNNGYEALHCTLMSHAGVWIEVQIRSRRMDDIAEKGIAAHWAYKNDGYISENDSEVDNWLGQIQEILLSNDVSALELLDIIHKDLVSTEIVVFTPKGDQKSIINGATALDFAYMIHTHIGNSAIAAKVNMKLVPLSCVLKSGDQVEIITAANAAPKMEWLQFLQTRTAKSKVMEYFRGDKDRIARQGRKIFEERIRMLGHKNSDRLLGRFMDYCQLKDVDEFYFRIGLGVLDQEQFQTIIDEDKMSTGGKRKYVLDSDHADNISYKIAECCNPIPGEPLIGFFIDEHTIMVHKKSCPVAERLASRYGNRMVVPQWSAFDREYPVQISLKGIDRVGLLNEISGFISKTLGINMRKLHLSTEGGVFEGFIELLVKDKRILTRMGEGLKKIEGIQDVVRTDI